MREVAKNMGRDDIRMTMKEEERKEVKGGRFRFSCFCYIDSYVAIFPMMVI